MTALPEYIDRIGHGAAALAAPDVFTGATGYLFAIEGEQEAMQATANKLLDAAAEGLHHTVAAPFFLVSIMDIARCASAVPPAVGWLPGRECAVWIPLLQHRGLVPRPILWAPYIFIDYTIGMVTGRETWGWPKVLAHLDMPADRPGEPAAFACRTTVFRTLSADTRGEPDATLLKVSGTKPLMVPEIGYRTGREAVEAIVSRLFGSLAASILNLLPVHPHVASVVLKQFRDVACQDRACYRRLVDSPIAVTRFDGMGLLEDRFELELLACESHQILHDMTGRHPEAATTRLPVAHAFWAQMDFEALPGKEL